MPPAVAEVPAVPAKVPPVAAVVADVPPELPPVAACLRVVPVPQIVANLAAVAADLGPILAELPPIVADLPAVVTDVVCVRGRSGQRGEQRTSEYQLKRLLHGLFSSPGHRPRSNV